MYDDQNGARDVRGPQRVRLAPFKFPKRTELSTRSVPGRPARRQKDKRAGGRIQSDQKKLAKVLDLLRR